MGFFTEKDFDKIRQEYAQLLFNYGFIDSVYDLVISVVEKKEWQPGTRDYYIMYEVYASKLNENEEIGDFTEIEAPKDSDLASYVYAEWIAGGAYYSEWNIGRGLTVEHAMKNLYCKLKEILEPDDEIEDCYA